MPRAELDRSALRPSVPTRLFVEGGGGNHWKITISQTRVPLIRIFFFAREVFHLSHLFWAVRVATGRALAVAANWGTPKAGKPPGHAPVRQYARPRKQAFWVSCTSDSGVFSSICDPLAQGAETHRKRPQNTRRTYFQSCLTTAATGTVISALKRGYSPSH